MVGMLLELDTAMKDVSGQEDINILDDIFKDLINDNL